MSQMQWFRLYADIVHDEKLRLLAFEDRWHFVAICSLKCAGLIDEPESDLRTRRIAVALGVQVRELDEIKRRLVEVQLIDDNLQPLKWEKRQYKKGNLPEGESLDGYRGYVYFIGDEKLKTVKIGYSKNPWARVKDLQTGRPAKLSVVATLKTTEVSETQVHDLFADEREAGEWFRVSPRIRSVIAAIREKEIADLTALSNYVVNYVATTKETEAETETDISPNGDCPSGDEPALKPEHVVETWNKTADRIAKPKVRDLTPERRHLVRARIAQYSIDDFVAVFGSIERSDFLRNWRGLSFDWAMKKANFQKILEGNYNG